MEIPWKRRQLYVDVQTGPRNYQPRLKIYVLLNTV